MLESVFATGAVTQSEESHKGRIDSKSQYHRSISLQGDLSDQNDTFLASDSFAIDQGC